MDKREFTEEALRRIEISVEHPARSWARRSGIELTSEQRPPHRVARAWHEAGCPLPPLGEYARGSWPDLIERYLRERQIQGRSTSSLTMYRYRLLAFMREVSPFAPRQVTRSTVLDYIDAHPGWQPDMFNQVRNVLSTFFEWACDDGTVDASPTTGLSPHRIPIRVPLPASEPTIRDAISGARPDVRLMILFGALGGLRRAEIANLHTGCFTEYGMRILGKGGRMRMVPIHPALQAEIDAYLAAIRLSEGYLFTWTKSDRPISPPHVGRLISKQLPPGVTAHKLRHRFAAKSYAGSYDIRAVQELLGHSSPDVTARYIATPAQSLDAAVAAVPAITGMAPQFGP